MRFEEVYEQYKLFYEANFKIRSIDSANSIFKLYILPFFKDKNMYEITKKDILDWENEIGKQNLSYKYKKDIYVFLAMFFKWCVKYLELENNVVSQVGFVLKNKQAPREVASIWTYKEFEKFIKCVDDSIYKAYFNFLFFTGCREGEAIALTFRDINKDIVSINRTVVKGGRGFNSPKTIGSIRKFKIDKKLCNEIKALKHFYQAKYPNFNDNFFVFGGIKLLSYTTIARVKNRACQKAGIKPIRIHDFRHSHITFLLSNGVPIKAVCNRVGHTDVNTTFNIYTHVLEKDNEEIIKALNHLRFIK